MKKTLLTIALCAGLLASGSTEAFAQRPGRGERNNHQTERTHNRGNNGNNQGRHQGASPSKPSNNSNKNNYNKEKPNRPYNNGNHNGNNNSYNRPGRQPQAHPQPMRPSAPAARPVGPVGQIRPGKPVRPVAPVRPVRPIPPTRPGRPVYQPWIRPVRPATWRPLRPIAAIAPLFGLNFGMGLNVSINLLGNRGYSVHEYGDGTLYINNVTELNMLWPEGILFYDNGGLARTQLYYSTPDYDINRYNQVYSILSSQYGYPVRTALPGGGVQATWFGNNGSYVQLDFSSRQTVGGHSGYFTTLTYGN